jgi:hypothetical protein
VQSLNCPHCGGSLQIENQFIRTITCPWCGSGYLVRGSDGLSPTGQSAGLADYPSRLTIGATGTIRKRGFKTLGRVRYAYDAGFWEEWQIAWDDGAPPDWLEEDEGLWTVYRRERIKHAVPPFDRIPVGGTISVNAYNVFVTEKRTARVSGSAGQFSSVLPLTGTFGYFQGTANDQFVSINYWAEEIELSIGDELAFRDLVIG